MRKKRVLIDVNTIIPYYTVGYATGIGRSTKELVSAISSLVQNDLEVCLYTQNTRGCRTKNHINLPNKHIYVPNRGILKNLINKICLKQILFNYDLFHVTNNTDATDNLKKSLFTIHDLIVYRFPEFWDLSEEQKNHHKQVARNCRHIVTCSESSKRDIIDFWNVPEEKITVIHWGINRTVFKPTLDENVLDKFNIDRNYFFCASCNHQRKNTPLVLEGFQKYIQLGGKNQLVLLSPLKEEIFPYRELIKENKIIVCSAITDHELTVLYSMAKSSIMLSLFEGFCFPLLESLACGTNCICSNFSCEREIIGELGDYIEPDCHSVAKKFLSLESTDKKLNESELDNLFRKYTWEKCALEYLDLYRKLLN